MERFLALERCVNRIVWGPGMMALLLGTGVYLSALCGFPQFTCIHTMLREMLGRRREKVGTKGGVSPFRALCTALAASIGTGNIAGVAGAIALGGPGAVFWMWVSALVGMCTKFAETALAVAYRQRDQRGRWVGGPMYYIQNGLGRRWRPLAGVFALLGMLAAFGMGNMTQVNTAAQTLSAAAEQIGCSGDERAVRLAVGVFCAVLSWAVLAGGAERIAGACAFLVPVMSAIYLGAALLVIVTHWRQVPAVFAQIIRCAFVPRSLLGGGAAIGFRQAMRQGIGRGIFSNEAGLGAGSIGHAAAETAHPGAQGLWGMLEVLIDTILICTATALVILLGVEQIPYGEDVGAALTMAGLASVLPGAPAQGVLAVCISLFALSTLLSWGFYGARCCAYLLGNRGERLYRFLYVGAAVAGAVMDLAAVWNIADTINGLLAVPNLIALLLLAPRVGKIAHGYFRRRG